MKQRVIELTDDLRSPWYTPSPEANRSSNCAQLMCGSSRCPPLLLRLCGILPWDLGDSSLAVTGGDGSESEAEKPGSGSHRLQVAVLVLVACAGVEMVAVCVLMGSTRRIGRLLSDFALAIGALAGLLSLGIPCGSRALHDCHMLLVAYGKRTNCLDRWLMNSWKDALATVVVWLLTVCASAARHVILLDGTIAPLDTVGAIDVCAFAIVSWMLLALAYCLQHFCCFLAHVVDAFGFQVFVDQDVGAAMNEWNILQAVLRKASGTIEWCFFCAADDRRLFRALDRH